MWIPNLAKTLQILYKGFTQEFNFPSPRHITSDHIPKLAGFFRLVLLCFEPTNLTP